VTQDRHRDSPPGERCVEDSRNQPRAKKVPDFGGFIASLLGREDARDPGEVQKAMARMVAQGMPPNFIFPSRSVSAKSVVEKLNTSKASNALSRIAPNIAPRLEAVPRRKGISRVVEKDRFMVISFGFEDRKAKPP
jgi:hypothetical protein